MKLDSIAAIAEISPYYGHLDDTYKLMKNLNWRTNNNWSKVCFKLSNNIKRKIFNLQEYTEERFKEVLIKLPIIHTLFKLSPIIINNEEKFSLLVELLQNIENPEMLSWEFIWMISHYGEERAKQSNRIEPKFQDLYNSIITIANQRNINLSNIASIVCVEDILQMKVPESITSVMFNFSSETDPNSIVSVWNNLNNPKTWKINKVIIDWNDENFENALISLKALNIQNIEINFYSLQSIKKVPQILGQLNVSSNSIVRFYSRSLLLQSDIYPNSKKKLELSNPYLIINKNSRKIIHFSKCIIEYKTIFIPKDSEDIEIEYSDIVGVEFETKLVQLKNMTIDNLNKIISINKRNISFDKWILKTNHISLSQI